MSQKDHWVFLVCSWWLFCCEISDLTLYWRKWFLHALSVWSHSYSLRRCIPQALENLPKHLWESDRVLDLFSHVHWKRIHPLVWRALLINITSPQRFSFERGQKKDFPLKLRSVLVKFLCSSDAAAVPQPPTLPLLVFVSDTVPVGIIAGTTVGSSILLLMILLALAFFFYRQRKGSELNTVFFVCLFKDMHTLTLPVSLSFISNPMLCHFYVTQS